MLVPFTLPRLRGTLVSPARRLMAATLLLGVGLAGCSSDDSTAPAKTVTTINVTPRVTALRIGTTQQLAVEVLDQTGAPITGKTVTWASTDRTVATVSESGLVTMLTDGSTAITATVDGKVGAAAVQGVAPVASVQLSLPGGPLPPGDSRSLVVNTLNAAGGPLVARATTFSSSNPAVATVSATGVVTGVTPGTATITATAEGRSGTVLVTVQLPPVATVTLTPNPFMVQVGGTRQLTVTLRDAGGNTLANRTVTYSSSNPAVATVSATGVVSVLANGNAIITATSEGINGTAVTGNVFPGVGGSAITSGALGSANVFYINMPAGKTGLSVTLSGAAGQDPDLYVFRPGNFNTPACESYNDGPSESCTFTSNVGAGLWAILIDGYTAYSNVTLTVTITPP